MADIQTVNVRRDGAVAILEIDNVKQRNAMTLAVKAALVPALEAAERDPDVRAIVLSGAGGTFSAGGDVSIFGEMTPPKARQLVFDQRQWLHLLVRGQTPVIAAVEGFAFGAGFGLAMATDHVVADRNAKFCASFNKIGLMPDAGLLWTLPQRIGMGRAKDMLMCASVVEGEEASRLGMVDLLAEPGEVQSQALAKAKRFADGPPLAMAAMKSAFATYPLDLEGAFALETAAQPALMVSADADAARKAFFAKQKPVFKGA